MFRAGPSGRQSVSKNGCVATIDATSDHRGTNTSATNPLSTGVVDSVGPRMVSGETGDRYALSELCV